MSKGFSNKGGRGPARSGKGGPKSDSSRSGRPGGSRDGGAPGKPFRERSGDGPKRSERPSFADRPKKKYEPRERRNDIPGDGDATGSEKPRFKREDSDSPRAFGEKRAEGEKRFERPSSDSRSKRKFEPRGKRDDRPRGGDASHSDRPRFRREDGDATKPFREKREGGRYDGERPGRPAYGKRDQPFEPRAKRAERAGDDNILRPGKPGFNKEGRDSDRPFREKRTQGGKFDSKRPEKRSFDKKDNGEKPFDSKRSEKRSFDNKDNREKSFEPREKRTDKPDRKVDTRPFRLRQAGATEEKRAGKDAGSEKAEAKKGFQSVVNNAFNNPPSKKQDEDHPGKREQFEDKVYGELEEPKETVKKPYEKVSKKLAEKSAAPAGKTRKKKYRDDEDDEEDENTEASVKSDEMPLNKYIAHSGECSRRDAAELVKQGKVKVNGELVMDPGHKVNRNDNVTLSGKKLTPQKSMVYLLLNKPKGYITTNDDPQGRKTVMELVGNAGDDRLFPVGRLDRDTSGLLLITNDGALNQKLCHPSFNIKKVYHVTLDKPLTKADFDKIMEGLELEDGKITVDEMAYLESKDELGLEIHSGKNRIVRRIFESLGYVVEKLDRMMYAGLTKKNLPRGKWRRLTDHEIVLLKHFKS